MIFEPAGGPQLRPLTIGPIGPSILKMPRLLHSVGPATAVPDMADRPSKPAAPADSLPSSDLLWCISEYDHKA